MGIYLCRHGETEWSKSGRHTGLTDIPLTKTGEEQAALMAKPLQKIHFVKTFMSPRLRARQTSELAGCHSEIDPDLAEWDYGDFEGLTSLEIKTKHPNWNLFIDGAPGGETPEQVGARADRVLKKLYHLDTPIAIFSHGHFCRILAVRYLGLPVSAGSLFYLDPASISHLGHEKSNHVIRLWNSIAHLDL